MPPPPGSSAPAPERRLAVLLSHLRPTREAPRATIRLASAERHGTAAAAEAEAEAGLSASPCAAGGSGSSGGGYCVFCDIVTGAAPAFKVCFPDSLSRSACNRVATRGALCLPWFSQPRSWSSGFEFALVVGACVGWGLMNGLPCLPIEY